MTSPHSFGRLLDAMPRIAQAVNGFRSPEIQRSAFDALMESYAAGVAEAAPADDAAAPGRADPPQEPVARPLGAMATVPYVWRAGLTG